MKSESCKLNPSTCFQKMIMNGNVKNYETIVSIFKSNN